MKKILIVFILVVMVLTLTPVRSNYAETNINSKAQHEVRIKRLEEERAKNSITINGTEYYLVMVPAPKIDDAMLIPALEANDSIFVDIK